MTNAQDLIRILTTDRPSEAKLAGYIVRDEAGAPLGVNWEALVKEGKIR